MRFMTWNIRGNTGIARGRLRRIAEVIGRTAPDVVVLQEVFTRDDVVEELVAQLAAAGLEFTLGGASRAGYSNFIASRWPLSPVSDEWFTGPRPGAATGAVVGAPEGPFVAVGAHVPNGSGNGWIKIETFEALADALHRLTLPVVLGGDSTSLELCSTTGRLSPSR